MSLCEQGFRSKFKNIALLQKWVAKEKSLKNHYHSRGKQKPYVSAP
jgi:hypothetical protein